MSQRGSISRRTLDGTSAAPAMEIIAVNRCRIIEMRVTLAAATLSTYGLGRPAALGLVPTTPVTLLNDASGDVLSNKSKTALAWSTAPTVPAQFIRRAGFPATIGAYVLWQFPNGLWIPAGGSIVLWNLAANGVADVDVTIDE